ncbi:6,7-dimethyl-8-ribityllumazine synthase, partial [Synchytrium endobioticum]
MADHTVKGVEPLPEGTLDGSDLRILIVHTRWNFSIVKQLLEGTISTLKSLKVPASSIVIESVPGSFELPIAAHRLLSSAQGASSSQNPAAVSKAFDAAICIGVLIKGSTMHFEYIAESATQGLMRVGLDTGIPVIFGVLTCLTE